MSVPDTVSAAASVPTLSENESRLLAALRAGPLDTNRVAANLGASLGSVARRLGLLQKGGLVAFDETAKTWSLTDVGVTTVDMFVKGEPAPDVAVEPAKKGKKKDRPAAPLKAAAPKGPAPTVRVGAKYRTVQETLTDYGWEIAEQDGIRHAFDLPGDGEDYVLWVNAPDDRVSEAEIHRINTVIAGAKARLSPVPEKDDDGKDKPLPAVQAVRAKALTLDLLVSGSAVHGATTMITCVDCGHQRRIHVQDAFQVKRCLEHQQAVARAKRGIKNKAKRAAKAAAKAAANPKPAKAPPAEAPPAEAAPAPKVSGKKSNKIKKAAQAAEKGAVTT